MKKSDFTKYIEGNYSRDDIRRIMYAKGVGNMYQETEMDSAMADMHWDISSTGDYVEQHSHLFFEIIYCVQGKVEYLLGTRRYPVNPGDVVLIPPGVIHMPIMPEEVKEPYERHIVQVSRALLNSLKQDKLEFEYMEEPMVLRTAGTKWEYISQYFARGIKENEAEETGWKICVCCTAAQLLVHLTRAVLNQKNCQLANPKEELLEQVLDYVQEHLSERITLTQTARHFLISESTLTHLFTNKMGIGFYHCVTQRRLVEAKKRIGEGLPMGQISLQVGFPEYSAFFRAFKEEYGISPMQYRKLLEGAENLKEA